MSLLQEALAPEAIDELWHDMWEAANYAPTGNPYEWKVTNVGLAKAIDLFRTFCKASLAHPGPRADTRAIVTEWARTVPRWAQAYGEDQERLSPDGDKIYWSEIEKLLALVGAEGSVREARASARI